MILFLGFMIAAVWYLQLPLWLQICLTVAATLAIFDSAYESDRVDKLDEKQKGKSDSNKE